MNKEFLHLEHDGKILLVNLDGKGPATPIPGRSDVEDGDSIRLTTEKEVRLMGIDWA